MDALAEMSEAQIRIAHLTHPPIRVCTKPRSQGQEGCERGSLNLFLNNKLYSLVKFIKSYNFNSIYLLSVKFKGRKFLEIYTRICFKIIKTPNYYNSTWLNK